ncbi:hypothetical protein Hypma_016130 [Hypsizygus marmoreus]|uniref:Uncharacterized protein n=1 Tax=Hypsizygus marmoreus TaxID=39966 RepID=A0A369K7J2_HYPMA|nr:hypothetical protein Hypma_016130 [Hypsizygus marmoreus]
MYETVIGVSSTSSMGHQNNKIRYAIILGGRAASTPGAFAPRRSYINSDTYPEDEPVWQWSAPE